MSNKFEQLLDLLVNEEMDKANELFHEIVVEKSREIYENMIAEEAEEEVDESSEEDEDEAVDEAMDDEDDMEESIEEETTLEIGGDATDDMMSDIEDPEAMDSDDNMGGDMAGDLGAEDEGSEEERIADLEDALEQLKAEFEQLMAGEEGGDMDDMDDGEDEMDDEEGEDEMDDEEGEGNPFAKESVREYVEKVSDGHGVEKKGRADTPDNGKSPVSTAKGRPSTSATAHNILGSKSTEAGGKGGQGLVGNVKGEFTKGVEKNITGNSKTKMPQGDTLSKVAAGHGAEKKGAGEGQAYTKSPADRAQ
jgi:hypothetical protein